jgi:hypothetical protein
MIYACSPVYGAHAAADSCHTVHVHSHQVVLLYRVIVHQPS